MASASGPDTRTIATLPSPGAMAVATAAMVSSGKGGGRRCLQCPPGLSDSGWRESRADHQIDMTAAGVAPFAELLAEGLMRLGLLLVRQRDQPLMYQIKRVIDQLSGLFRSHGSGSSYRPM